MKTKPFNLEEARAGKPFIHYLSDDDTKIYRKFIGVMSNGKIAYERRISPTLPLMIDCCEPEFLRMIVEPTKTTVYLYRGNESGRLFSSTSGPEYYCHVELVGQSIIEWEEK
jgi:hypothetical protein